MIIFEILGGVKVYGLPKELREKVYYDLTFENKKYTEAKKRGRYIPSDMMPNYHFFSVNKDEMYIYIPRGYFFVICKEVQRLKLKYRIIDRTLKFPKLNLKFKGTPRDYQDKAVKDLMRYPNGVLQGATGCLVGNTQIRMNRAGKGFSMDLDYLYKKFNKIKTEGVRPYKDTFRRFTHREWDLTIPTYIRSYNHHENQILLNEIANVVYSGVKRTYTFTLEDEKTLTGTADHKVLTKKGWIELGKLKKNDMLMIDNHKAHTKKGIKKEKNKYKTIEGLKYHPFSTKWESKNGRILYRRALHIIIYEAYINDLGIHSFISILKNNKNLAVTLRFVDSATHHIHHIDEICSNNEVSNLQLMTISEHRKLHSNQNRRNFNQGVPTYSKVIKRICAGKQSTYDIQCYSPYNNFTANDIVVHNCGKTFMGINLIYKRQQPTLIIVHSKELLNQWKDNIEKFLTVTPGIIGDGKFDIQPITIGIINSVRHKTEELREKFSHIILDEVHRSPASIYTETIGRFLAKYYLGLSATVYRSDGLGPAINAFVGPTMHQVDKEHLFKTGAVLKPTIIRVPTSFQTPPKTEYPTVINKMVRDEYRNNMIVKTVLNDIRRYNKPVLIVSDRVIHCEILADMLEVNLQENVSLLLSKIPKKQRLQAVEDIRNSISKVLIATVSLIGEGFDAPNLHALFLTTPIKYEGRIVQTVGRVLRPEKGKTARVYDFRDDNIWMLRASGKKRDKTYKQEWS